MGKNVLESIAEELKDPEFKREWDALEHEYQVVDSMIKARAAKKLTQAQLSQLTGIAQADISKIERGSANPSVRTLQRLASAMDMDLKIDFVKKSLIVPDTK